MGKAHKPYEFGEKIGLTITSKRLIITSIKAFTGNPNDGKTIKPLLEQMEKHGFKLLKELVYDRAARGIKEVKEVKILTANKPQKSDTECQKQSKRRKLRRRAAIEPVIGHLKSDHRMLQNYLHGESAPQINAFLAAAERNWKKLMNRLSKSVKKYFWDFFFRFLFEKYLIKNYYQRSC